MVASPRFHCWILSCLPLRLVTAGPAAGKSPPMGWSTWNHNHWEISQDLVAESADAMQASGLLSLGYNRVNLDGGWWAGANSGEALRNASGFLQAHPDKFPDMPDLSRQVHDLGFLFGLYANSGPTWCNKDKGGGLGYERQDVSLFASWGADMLKVDACGLDKGNATANATHALMATWHGAVQEAAAAQGTSPMLLSNCHNGCMSAQPRHGGWAPWCAELTDMWRTSSDIDAVWDKMLHNLDSLRGIQDQAGPLRGWNDPDILEVGNSYGRDGPLTDIEGRSHFSLWCVTSAPLLLGCDVRNMSKATLETLSNPEAIAVNQQWAGHAGDRVWASEDGRVEVWGKPQPDQRAALAIFNRGATTSASFSLDLALLLPVLGLPEAGAYDLRDVWLHTSIGTTQGSAISVRPILSHDSIFLVVSAANLLQDAVV